MGVNNKTFAEIRGVDPSRVSQWKRQGRLIFDADGKIDAAATNAALDASLDQVKGARRFGNVTSISPAAAAGVPAQERIPEGATEQRADAGDRAVGAKEGTDYWQHKAKREKAEAQLSEMKALREAGALTWTAGVKKESAETARKFRNLMLAIPDQHATVLASMTSPTEIHKYLTTVIQKALREFGAQLDERATAAARADESDVAVV